MLNLQRSFNEGCYVLSVFIGHTVPELAKVVLEEIVTLDGLDVGLHFLGNRLVVKLSVA